MNRVAILALCALGSCDGTKEGAKARAGGRGGAQAVPVEVALAEQGNLADRWTFLGNVRSGMQAELAAGASGAVRWVGPREGDVVARGTSLVRIDGRVARAKLHAAKAEELRAVESLAQARREVARLSRLGKEARSELELERAQSTVRLANAETALLAAKRKQAAAELSLFEVKAPFPGVITLRRVDPGDWVSVGTKVLDILSNEELEVLVDVSPRLLQFVSRGTAAILLRRDGSSVPARVVGVVAALDPVARTARLRLLPTKPSGEKKPALRAGAAIRVAFDVRHRGGAVVPRDALVVGPTATRVVRVVDGKARPVVVDVLVAAESRALVLSRGAEKHPLRAGDQIIVRGNERVRPGQLVRAIRRKKKP